jgi:hypothetical protein
MAHEELSCYSILKISSLFSFCLEALNSLQKHIILISKKDKHRKMSTTVKSKYKNSDGLARIYSDFGGVVPARSTHC